MAEWLRRRSYKQDDECSNPSSDTFLSFFLLKFVGFYISYEMVYHYVQIKTNQKGLEIFLSNQIIVYHDNKPTKIVNLNILFFLWKKYFLTLATSVGLKFYFPQVI